MQTRLYVFYVCKEILQYFEYLNNNAMNLKENEDVYQTIYSPLHCSVNILIY